MKPWPSCRHSHPFVWAASALYREFRLTAVLPSRVVVKVNRSASKLCVPIELRRLPQTLQDAKYSVPFMVAFSLVHGEPTLANLNDASLSDAAVLAMASKVAVEPTNDDAPGLPHACIRIQVDGLPDRMFDAPYVAPDPAALVEHKFRACLAFAGFGEAEVVAAWELLGASIDGDCVALLDLLAVAPRVGAAAS